MFVTKREILEADLHRIKIAFSERVASYKAKGVWSQHEALPLSCHNGFLCCDASADAIFTQAPYHPTQVGNARYVVLVGNELVVLQQKVYPQHSIEFVSAKLIPSLGYVIDFATESLRLSGNEGATFYTEASALTL